LTSIADEVRNYYDPKTILITGGCGFIASFLVKRILDTTEWDIIILSKSESKHGNIRLADIGAVNNPRVRIVRCDFSSGVPPIANVDYIAHLGAESHVDTSISEPEMFLRSNVMGTFRMLEYARTLPNLKKFLYFSTDEVYGPAQPGEQFIEWSRYNSCNPYAATKAAGEELCLAWENTYKVPVVITHCMNVFGERQHPEKFIPMVVSKVMGEEIVTIHQDAAGNSVVRSFVYGGEVAEAILRVLEHGKIRQKYGIKGSFEISIKALAQSIADRCGRSIRMNYKYPKDTRPGVDTRYAVGGNNMKDDLGWEPSTDTTSQFNRTIEWYIAHREWF
jgi:dTDP-glucose 4,6-dehydratase